MKSGNTSEAKLQWFTTEAGNIMNGFFSARFNSDCDAFMDAFLDSERDARSADAVETLWKVLQDFVGPAELTAERVTEVRKLLGAAQVGDDFPLLEHLQVLWAEVWTGLPEFAKPSDEGEVKRLCFTAEAETIVHKFFAARTPAEAKSPSQALQPKVRRSPASTVAPPEECAPSPECVAPAAACVLSPQKRARRSVDSQPLILAR